MLSLSNSPTPASIPSTSSGLEPADPGNRSGAELTNVKSAALEENIVGISVEVREHAEGLVVVKPLRGGPAAEAGVETGDIILSINDQNIGGMKMASSVDLMKGTNGSQMRMRDSRDGKGERDFALTRRSIRVWTVNDTKFCQAPMSVTSASAASHRTQRPKSIRL